MKVKHIALTHSLVSFAIGFSDLHENMFFWLMRPVGAVAFIAFFIFALLGNEFSIMDEQARIQGANQPFPGPRGRVRAATPSSPSRLSTVS